MHSRKHPRPHARTHARTHALALRSHEPLFPPTIKHYGNITRIIFKQVRLFLFIYVLLKDAVNASNHRSPESLPPEPAAC
jgi:hypothetical protein